MSLHELDQFLTSGATPERDLLVTAKLARWIYRKPWFEDPYWAVRIAAVEAIATADRAPWARAWLLNELEKQKATEMGDWIAIALTRVSIVSTIGIEQFIALYHDPEAHIRTRGSVIFNLSYALGVVRDLEASSSHPEISDELLESIRQTCELALHDEGNPYARGGACWLATFFPEFEPDLQKLSRDRTIIPGVGTTVCSYIHDW